MARHYKRENDLIHLQIRTDDKGEQWQPPHRFNLTGDRSMPECGIAIAVGASEKKLKLFFTLQTLNENGVEA